MKKIIFSFLLAFISFGVFGQNECAPNDVFSDACLISFGAEIGGTINPANDKDYYKFEVTTPGVIEINVSDVPSNIDMLVRLYDSSQSQLTYSDGSNGQAIFVEWLVCDPGIYYVLLTDNESNTDQYSLKVSFDATDVYECNNTFSDASLIEFDSEINASIRGAWDKDYYKFEVTQPGVMEINISNVPPNIGMNVFLYNDAQEELYSLSGNNGQPISFNFNIETIETYYILLTDNNSNTEQYALLLDFLTPVVDVTSQASNTIIQPNPSTNSITIQSQFPIQSIQIFDAIGNQMFTQKEGDLNRIETSNWQSGIYFILIQTEAGLALKKLLKQ